MPKTIYISVINDLVTDNRVHKVCITLQEMGFEVTLIGRKLPNSLPMPDRSYNYKRMRLLFTKGPAFYIEYNIHLLFVLLFSKADIFLSNDLDTLLANFIASELRKKPLVYDSHEYFTEVPELINRPKVKRIWEKLEAAILPKLKYAYTVCDSIAQIYREKYGTPFQVVRNLPMRSTQTEIPTNKIIDTQKKIILYQGALNIGRGLECTIEAMQYLDDALLLIAGDGDISEKLQSLTKELQLEDRVRFLGKIPLEEMKFITAKADLGLSVEEDMGLNYRFALPNKLFDYIQQEVPVLVSNLPEMKRIVENYRIGAVLKGHAPKQMADQLKEALNNRELREEWKKNLAIAAHELCWENEKEVIVNLFNNLSD